MVDLELNARACIWPLGLLEITGKRPLNHIILFQFSMSIVAGIQKDGVVTAGMSVIVGSSYD